MRLDNRPVRFRQRPAQAQGRQAIVAPLRQMGIHPAAHALLALQETAQGDGRGDAGVLLVAKNLRGQALVAAQGARGVIARKALEPQHQHLGAPGRVESGGQLKHALRFPVDPLEHLQRGIVSGQGRDIAQQTARARRKGQLGALPDQFVAQATLGPPQAKQGVAGIVHRSGGQKQALGKAPGFALLPSPALGPGVVAAQFFRVRLARRRAQIIAPAAPPPRRVEIVAEKTHPQRRARMRLDKAPRRRAGGAVKARHQLLVVGIGRQRVALQARAQAPRPGLIAGFARGAQVQKQRAAARQGRGLRRAGG